MIDAAIVTVAASAILWVFIMDPTVSDSVRGDAMAPLHDMADSLYLAGVRRIRGRLVDGRRQRQRHDRIGGDVHPEIRQGAHRGGVRVGARLHRLEVPHRRAGAREVRGGVGDGRGVAAVLGLAEHPRAV